MRNIVRLTSFEYLATETVGEQEFIILVPFPDTRDSAREELKLLTDEGIISGAREGSEGFWLTLTTAQPTPE